MRPEPATDRADRADRADRVDSSDRAVSAGGPDDPVELDAVDAFGHPALADPARDDAEWPDGDEDDIDV
ncbi:hypothetical protein [Curtobacterium sp. L1-20]|uniref:hypothetical protein n=1 Tax=Curtobacterium sp. L1-20 TaxID=3138181 RepID=UPI003B523876